MGPPVLKQRCAGSIALRDIWFPSRWPGLYKLFYGCTKLSFLYETHNILKFSETRQQ